MLAAGAWLGSHAEENKFEQLYLAYRQVMFYAANSILKDPAMAEDAVHQAFIRILNHMGKIGEVHCPQTRSFVVIIVRNVAINLYNSRKNSLPFRLTSWRNGRRMKRRLRRTNWRQKKGACILHS